jgi:hypothetical protein
VAIVIGHLAEVAGLFQAGGEIGLVAFLGRQDRGSGRGWKIQECIGGARSSERGITGLQLQASANNIGDSYSGPAALEWLLYF